MSTTTTRFTSNARPPVAVGESRQAHLLPDPGEVAAELLDASRPLVKFPCNPRVEDRQVPLIERIVVTSPEDPEWVEAVLGRLPDTVVEASRCARCSWECRREVELVDRVLYEGAELSSYLFYEDAKWLIRRELGLVPGRPRRVLFIGSGPLPLTAMLVHADSGARVTCLDCDSEAVDRSRCLLSRLGLLREIRVRHGRGEEFPAGGYDLVVVAVLAKPKAPILANVRRTMRPGGHILCRTALGLRSLLYEPAGDPPALDFERDGSQAAVGRLAVSTMLLRPR